MLKTRLAALSTSNLTPVNTNACKSCCDGVDVGTRVKAQGGRESFDWFAMLTRQASGLSGR